MTPRFVRLSLVLPLLAASLPLSAQQTPPASPAPVAVPSLTNVPTGPAIVTAPTVKPVEDKLLQGPIKLSETTIDAVLELLSSLTKRSILRPAALPTATYTLKIDGPILESELILALETLLKHNQIGVAPQGTRFLNIIPLGTVKNETPEMIEGSTLGLPQSGKIATKIFQLDFLKVQEFMPLIQNSVLTLGVQGGVVILQQANAAMITDTVSNLQRVETLLKSLDHPVIAGMTPKFYTLRNGAKASEMVNKLSATLRSFAPQLGSATTYNADDRTNQIILMADPRLYPFFDDLIAKLDIKADPNTRSEVIYLKHAVAKDVAGLLKDLVLGQTNAAQKSGAQSVRPGQVVLPAQPGAGPQPVAAPQPASGMLTGGGDLLGGTSEFSTLVSIGFDDRSNSIVVYGTGDDIRLLRELIDKIDVVLPQVRIEVIIAEVTLSDSQTSGISALGLTVNTDTPNNPATSGDNGRGTHITGINPLTVAGWNITSGIVNPLSFQAALSDNGKRSNVKVLQAPTIVTTHNKKATIKSGSQVPVVTASTSTPTTASTSGLTTQNQVTFRDILLQLDVTPLIGDDGSIQMNIDQKVDDVISNVIVDGNSTPIIGTRQATSFVTVNDGQMIVLGGLQRTKSSRSRAKIGFIYEIPILSQLLGARENSVERTELLLFIRPHVIKLEDATADTNRNIDFLSNKEQVNQYLKDPSKPSKDTLIEKLK